MSGARVRLVFVATLTVMTVLLLSLPARPAYASTLTVTTLADTGSGSLREAIINAVSGDQIGFSVSGTITLESQLPLIDKTLTIDGSTSPGSITIARDTLASNFGLMQITSSGNLTLNHLTLSHGSTTDSGGAIENLGTLMVNNVTFSDNTASVAGGVAGGALYLNKASASATITNSAFTDNTALEGGAIYVNFGTLNVTNTRFTDNTATSGGAGGIFVGRDATTITGCTFTDNQGVASVGGAVTTSGTLLTVSDSSFIGNSAAQGGGIYSYTPVTITNSTFTNNQATVSDGGGIVSGDTLSVTASIFSGNQAAGSGGAIASSATTTVTSSTFSTNSAANGGGIDNSFGTLTLTNSTLSGNTSSTSGGGINNDNGGTLTVTNSTISGNSANTGGGIDNAVSSTLTLNNSIIANSTSGGDCVNSATFNASHSLIKDSTNACGVTNGTNGNIVGANPLLGTLANNGGTTKTFALLSGSPAIDAGDNTLAVDASSHPLVYDQRGTGYARIFNGTVDMGSYEFGSASPGATTNTSQPSAPVSALCADVTSLANDAITVSGGIQNVLLNGVSGNTYCHLIAQNGTYLTSPAEIGVQSVISLGVVNAVDVFGQLPGGTPVVPFVSPVTVCLQGSGDVLFLSAADASRTPQHLAASANGGSECVSVPNSGTVVLVGSVPNIPTAPPTSDSSAATTLTDCEVTTTHSPLNLRAEPNTSADVIAQLPYNLALRATAHVPSWYEVVYLDRQGWISDQFVTTAGNCGG